MNPPRVIGHRGAAGHAPENTLESIRTAARLGAPWVEFDVHLSSDKIPVLIHDDTLDRTTDGKGAVDKNSLADLRSLDAGQWFADQFAGEPIPTLEETLLLLATLGVGANVEIKPTPGREIETGHAVARLLREQWPSVLPPPVLSSFKPESLAAAREVAPHLPRALLISRLSGDWARILRELDCTALHSGHKRLSASDAEQVRRAGYPLRVYTVNERAISDRLFSWGAEAIISDYPDRIL
ncbi:MAG: glycerophosphodiester phosphodiesterase [Alphaproteobacteria bacterium]|nr:glycerophosphodiester phosphodiesterase [Alphaproteobacteria bacterium]